VLSSLAVTTDAPIERARVVWWRLGREDRGAERAWLRADARWLHDSALAAARCGPRAR